MKKRLIQIGIVGWAGMEEYPKKPFGYKNALQLAEEAGKFLANSEVIVFTGGRGGVMEAVAKGVKGGNGISVGIVKGEKRKKANKNILIEIVSGTTTGGSENILVTSVDGLLVFGGGAGTLQEIALAWRLKKPIVICENCGGWGQRIIKDDPLDERASGQILVAKTAKEAVNKVLYLVRKL